MAKKVVALIILALFLYISSPLLLPVAMSAVFAVLLFPQLERLERRKIPTSWASALLTLGITLVVLIPITILIIFGAKAGLQQVKAWKDLPSNGSGFFENLVDSSGVHQFLEKVSSWLPVTVEDLVSSAQDVARTVSLQLASIVGDFVTQLPGVLMGLVIIVIGIYFFLVDGRNLVMLARRNSVFTASQTDQLIKTFAGLCRSVILASMASGIAQSVIYSTVCLFMGVKNVPLVAFSVFLTSFIPLVGSAPITLGVAVYEFFSVSHTIGIVLFIFAGVVAVVDNFVRPVILKGKSNLHPLLAFIGAFGGIKVIGFSGVFIGPILAGLLVETFDYLLAAKSK